jgi:putative FmdB family regulatory protein
MPFYDFLCPKCGHEFSKMLPIGQKEAVCQLCQHQAKKKISAPAIHFSGSGFYASDNKKQTSARPEAKTEPSPKKEDKSPSEKKPKE